MTEPNAPLEPAPAGESETKDRTSPPAETSPAAQTLTDEERRRSLRRSIADGSAYSVMVGLGDSYISPYAIFLNASNTQIGLLTAIPQAAGALFQLIGIALADTLKKRKLVSLLGSALQALMWVPIVYAPFLFEGKAPTALIIFWSLYVGFVFLTLPAWNSWMGDLVSPATRGRYFGRRNGWAQVASFVSYVIGGLLLQYFTDLELTLTGFLILFVMAFMARLVSIYFLSRIHEPVYVLKKEDRFTFWDFLRRAPSSNFARFVFYVGIFHFAVFLSAPFFAVYMLKELNFSYAQFMISNGVAVVATLFALRSWGRVGDKYGNKKVLTLTGFLVPIVPILWTISRNYYYLLAVQMVAGFAWGGFSLSASNFLFDAVSPPKRARCAGYLNLITGLAMFLGAAGGGVLVDQLTEKVGVGAVLFQYGSHLQTLFLLSGVLRLAVTVAFLRLFNEVKEVEPISAHKLFFTTLQIWPPPNVILRLFASRDKEDAEGNGGEGVNG